MISNRYEYDAMAKCEHELWWYRCLHELTIHRIKTSETVANPRVLDAGCGTGGMLLQLKKKGYTNLAGFDLSSHAVTYARERSGLDIRLLDITGFDNIYPENYFDIIISHDIVCLLQDGHDKIALSKLLAVLKPGGLLLMNLPALKAFSGTHDIAVGIKRRYSKKSLKRMVEGVAEIKELTYWPFFLSPAVFFTRCIQQLKLFFKRNENLVSDVKMPPVLFNRLFYRLTRLEVINMRIKPWGSSLFLVLQKPL